jgi:hypothetical protein
MKEFLDKLTSYHIFNYLLPGVLFVILADKIASYKVYQTDIIFGLILYYFIGLVISRVGSLIVEPLLKGVKFIVFADYKDFVSASKSDSKIEILSETNNMYRTLCALFIMLLLLKAYNIAESNYPFITSWNAYILIVILLAMFIFAYRKQCELIVKRVMANNNKGIEGKKPGLKS